MTTMIATCAVEKKNIDVRLHTHAIYVLVFGYLTKIDFGFPLIYHASVFKSRWVYPA